MSTSIKFLGAAQTVTGSRYLVETDGARVLVDCGLFQGLKSEREKNRAPLPFDAASLDAVVLTHAHIDHSGYLPRLCAAGFTGPVYCTPGTADLLQILLPDSGHLQEEEARHANKWGYSRHRPALPLYTQEDARNSLQQLSTRPYYARFDVAPGVSVRFTRAGHIIGSACVAMLAGQVRINFTGDVGRPADPIMKPPDPLEDADVLITESTYGDRRHPQADVRALLEQTVRETARRGGVILVPAFAVGRAQHLMHLLAQLKTAGRIPDVPVYLDSPMAIKATGIFCNHREDHRLSEAECRLMCDGVHYARTPDDSKAIDQGKGPMIVISASGMATGGRILHHLKRFLPDPQNAVLFVGYQAAGTRGRSIVDGADEVKIHGQYVKVGASVVQAHGLSAHADYREMLDWFAAGRLSPHQVFVTHGEPSAADAFRRRLKDTFGWNAQVPVAGTKVEP
jgi:metallo-beta-lactamase family protein